MAICKECGKNVAVLACMNTSEGLVMFDMCDDCFERIYNEIFEDTNEEEDDDDEFTL